MTGPNPISPRLEQFLRDAQGLALPEAPTPLHTGLTKSMWAWVKESVQLPEDASILDIGCGQGAALEMFHGERFNVCGVTCNPEDYVASSDRVGGEHVYFRDMHALEACDGSMDFVWLRHALEHSPIPSFVLAEIFRILKPGGHLYVEVPSPGTPANHESNPSHFSVLGKAMWEHLFRRAGFEMVKTANIELPLDVGPDVYFAWLLSKPEAPPCA